MRFLVSITLFAGVSAAIQGAELRAWRLLEHEFVYDADTGQFYVYTPTFSTERDAETLIVDANESGTSFPASALGDHLVVDNSNDIVETIYVGRRSPTGGPFEVWELSLPENDLAWDPTSGVFRRGGPSGVPITANNSQSLGLESAAAQVSVLNLPTNDLVYDAVSGMLYASTPARAGASGSSIVPIDPVAGSIGAPVSMGSEPGTLALSDDGQNLFVSLESAFAIRVFDVPTQTPGLEFSLGSDPFFGPYLAEDIEVQPGNSGVIAVSLKFEGVSASHGGVAIYDNGVMRLNATPKTSSGNRIEFSSDPSLLYAYYNQSTEYGFRKIAVDANGATETSVHRFISGFSVDIEYADGLIYSTMGRVLEPNIPSVVGTFPEVSFARGVQIDAARALAYFLDSNEILVFDSTRFTLIDRIAIPGISGTPGSLVLYGPGMLAFRTSGDQVFLVDVGDAPTSPTITTPIAGSMLSSSTAGFTWDANGAVVDEWWLYVGSGVGNNDLFDSGSLGTTTSVTATGLPTDGRPLHVRLRYSQSGVWNFADFDYTAANIVIGASGVRAISLPTNDLIYDAVTGLLYASVPGRALGTGNSIVPIDPNTGETGTPVFVGSEPGPLALSDDGQVLYVSLDGAFAIRQLDMASQTPGLQFDVGGDPTRGPFSAEDIEVQPGSPSVVAASLQNLSVSPRHAGVAIYDNGVMRTQRDPKAYGQ